MPPGPSSIRGAVATLWRPYSSRISQSRPGLDAPSCSAYPPGTVGSPPASGLQRPSSPQGTVGSMIGKTIAHYRILEPLGAGGMGEVYRARDQHLDRDVAVKVLRRGSLADPTSRERFRREAPLLSRLSHPGVATIFDFDPQDDLDFPVMWYVPGVP